MIICIFFHLGTVYSLTTLELTPLLYGSAAKEYFGLSVMTLFCPKYSVFIKKFETVYLWTQISGSDLYPGVSDDIFDLLTEMLWSQVEVELRMQLSESLTQYLNDELLVFTPLFIFTFKSNIILTVSKSFLGL